MSLFLIIILSLLLFLASPLIAGAILLWKKRPMAGWTVLAVSVALIGSFVIYGNLERRGTVGHIVRWCEGEDGAHQDVNDFAEDAKKVVNPYELQQWAMTVITEAQTTKYPPDEFPRDKVLPGIRNLQSRGELFEDVEFDDPNSAPHQSRSVWIWWGGPFGHWGLRVGSPTFKPNDPYDDNYYIEWKPGIYFWCETH